MSGRAVAQTPVLIVGGGPVGLAMALELAYQGVRSTLVERAAGVEEELLAKAGTLSARSVEFCRRWGVADDVASWGADPDYPRDTCYVTALHGGHLLGRDKVASANQRRQGHSPEMLRKCPQHVFDPLLARTVAAAGMTDLRYGTEYTNLRQDDDGVTVELRGSRDQCPATLRARYVVACDGAASALRSQLGIAFDGRTLDYSVSAMLRVSDLHAYHPIGRATRYMFVGTEGTWANLTSVDYADLWRFTLLGSEERIAPERIDMRERIVTALGRDDVPFELFRALPWRRSQYTAERYHYGRVLLAGDAAHTMSPTGGHGLNTGLGDVVGLGWMLAAVLHRWGGPRLLDAYDAERRPVAIRNGSSSTSNYETWVGQGLDFSRVLDDGAEADAARASIGRTMSDKLHNEWHADGVRMGYRYENSPLIARDGTPEPPDDPVDYVPTARPGHRAPHAWLPDGSSVLDYFGRGFTLLRLGRAPADPTPLADAAHTRGLPLTVHTLDSDEATKAYERALVLVRPDGHVAWRADHAPSADDARALIDRVRGAAHRSVT